MKSLRTYMLSAFSFSNSILEVIIPLLIFSYVPKEDQVGYWVSIFALVSFFAVYAFGRWCSYTHYQVSLRWSGTVYALSLLCIILFPSYWYVVLFSSILNFVAMFFSLPQKVISDNVLCQLSDYQQKRAEYMVIREIFMIFGWLATYITLYYL